MLFEERERRHEQEAQGHVPAPMPAPAPPLPTIEEVDALAQAFRQRVQNVQLGNDRDGDSDSDWGGGITHSYDWGDDESIPDLVYPYDRDLNWIHDNGRSYSFHHHIVYTLPIHSYL